MMPKSIRTKLITYISVLVTVTVGLSTLFISLLLFNHLDREHRSNLSNQARHKMLRLEMQIGMLMEHTTRLAESHFIINGLIDPQGRENYLPKVAEDFSKGRDVLSFALVDFDGEPLFIKGERTPDFNASSELRLALSMGQSGVFLSQPSHHLLMVAPVRYYYTTQGAVVIQYDLEAMARRLMVHSDQLFQAIVLEDRNRFVFNFHPDVEYLTEVVMADDSAPLLRGIHAGVLVGTPSADFLAPIHRAVSTFVLFGMILVIGAVVAAIGLGKSFSRPILELSDRVRRVGGEGGALCAPLGSNDELEILAQAFDARTQALNSIQKELELRVRERTAELQRSEATLMRAQKVALLGSWRMEVASGRIVWSDGVYDLLGLPPGTTMDYPTFVGYIHPDDRAKVARSWQNAMEGQAVYDIEHRILVNDSVRWIRELAEFQRDEQGTVTEVIGTVQCITDRQAAQESIRLLSQAVDQSSSDIMITNREGYIIYVNPKCIESTGFAREELINNKPGVIRSGNTPASVYETMWQSIVNGQTWRGELHNRRKDGSLFWEYAVISPVRDSDGTITHYLAIKDDITEKKRLEEERAQALSKAELASQAKSEFLANMSHEIRTPMNAIIGLSHLCLQTRLTAKQKDYIRKVHTSATSLLGIINDILDFSKIDAGRLDMESIEFTLDEVLGNLSSMVSIKAHEKHLEFIMRPAVDIPRVLVGDPLRLGQILLNLASNSVKFTQKGEVSIATHLLERDDQGVRLQFVIQDTGIGMTGEQIDRLFQAFSQADSSITRRYGGTGLGLAISKRLIALMDGSIQVESQVGVGSRFQFDVRLGVGREVPVKPSLPGSHFAGMRALVVDDNVNACDVMTFYLNSFSFIVDQVQGGQEAILAVRQADQNDTPYSLVLIDYMMPEVDGITAATTIRFQLALRSPPLLIVATAYGEEEVVRRATQEAHVDGFLVKPVSQSMLLEAIMEAFGHTARLHPQEANLLGDEREFFTVLSGAKILLAEDNEINRQVAMELLEQANITVVAVENGLEAVDRLLKERFDGVLMDVQMPGMDGLTATREIRRIPGLTELPILAMTANAMSGDRELCLEAGMQDHIAKPVVPREMFATLARWIKAAAPQPLPVAPHGDEVVEEPLTPDLPMIAGLNVKAGVARMGGRVDGYLKLLSRFCSNQRSAVAAIRQALRALDVDTACRLAHTLKGVAATIGAESLSWRAADVESRLRTRRHHDNDDLNALLEQMAVALESLCQSIDASVPHSPPVANVFSVAQVEDAKIINERNALMLQAFQQLESYDASAEETLARMQRLPMTDDLATDLIRVMDKVAQYDFESARDLLRGLAMGMGVNLANNQA
ncbi:MAG: response regulator [Magnetococcales bacterium]|nr:response regulator [Magnetococcales bacterium]